MKDIADELVKLRSDPKFDAKKAVRIQSLELERKKLKSKYMRMING